jgi:glutamate-1-semialdehyde aminotransferase
LAVNRSSLKGHGAHLWDADGRELIDYVGTWGQPAGHAPRWSLTRSGAAANGFQRNSQSCRGRNARLICAWVPSIEKVRCQSGTEATMSCIRLARGFTGREKLVSSKAVITVMSIVAHQSRLRRALTMAQRTVPACPAPR